MMEDEDELPLDNAQECESMQCPLSQIQDEESSRLVEERQRLAEAVKHHQINRHAVQEQPEGARRTHSSYAYYTNTIQNYLKL
jgi:hypothetical protein